MTSRLAIVGAGGHGREALMVARRINRLDNHWADIIFLDDVPARSDELARLGATLAGGVAMAREPDIGHVIAIGDPSTRRVVSRRIGGDTRASTLIDPNATIGPDVMLGDGFMAYPGAIITTNVRIGVHTHVNCAAVISHDCRVGDFVSVSPGVMINGNVEIGDEVLLGTGAVILPGRTIGQGAVIGAGAVVCDDVEPWSTVVGSPARPVRDAARPATHAEQSGLRQHRPQLLPTP